MFKQSHRFFTVPFPRACNTADYFAMSVGIDKNLSLTKAEVKALYKDVDRIYIYTKIRPLPEYT